DLCLAANMIPKRRWLYRILAIGYQDTPKVRERHERSVWWSAVIILPIMVSVHSVYGYVFGLQAGRPGWFNPILAPYFVLGAIVSGFSAMIIIAAIVRKTFPWKQFLPPRMFKGLGVFLGFVIWLYMYFLFSEILTGQYSPPEADNNVWSDILWGRFAILTWCALLGGLLIPFAALFIQGVTKRICSVALTVTAAVMCNIGLWCIRYLIVVPTFYHPHLPYRITPYVPTLEEGIVMGGTWVFAILFFSVLLKIVPVIELPEDTPIRTDSRFVLFPWITLPGRLKNLIIAGVTLFSVAMVVYGISTWQGDYAPLKWLTGIGLICIVPLLISVLIPREECARPPSFPRAHARQYMTSATPWHARAPRMVQDKIVASPQAGRPPP
ncbi:MAG: polysulfide reductase NrfD, partial [candidate division Zixibacteria bacterium]|nr:polysulfide reductase NrfD [candidate division Zixibacteria bacterium]